MAAERCDSCGRPLVTGPDGRCASCGTKIGFIKRSRGRVRLTQVDARRTLERLVDKERKQERKQVLSRLDRKQRRSYLEAESRAAASASLSWSDAETLARDWMRKNGYADAVLTAAGADRGIDVNASKAVAQVKHHAKPVGRPAIQQLFGAASSQHKKAIFFSRSGYTKAALEWARTCGVETYIYPPVTRVK